MKKGEGAAQQAAQLVSDTLRHSGSSVAATTGAVMAGATAGAKADTAMTSKTVREPGAAGVASQPG